jgi:hypothetical protein
MRPAYLLATAGLGIGLALGAAPISALAQSTSFPTAKTPAPAPSQAIDPNALKALRGMGAYLATLTNFTVKSQAGLDVITNDGQRIQLDGEADYKVRRPDGFVIDMVSDMKKRRFYYDGKQFTIYAPALNYYATAPAPATITATLDKISDKFGITLPLEDLFRWNDPKNGRADQLQSGFVVGPATIDGVETTQYAFREADVDWQIWIQQGDQPLPRKLMIVDRKDPAHPAYVAVLTWNVNPTFAADEFVFKPDAKDKAIRLAEVGQQEAAR